MSDETKPEPTLAELQAQARAHRDAKALAAYVEYSSIDDRFVRARALSRLGSELIARGCELAQPAKKE